MNLLEVKNLSRSYGDFLAVDDVSFEIDTGEIVGLLGHNGAGKTTIMKMLTGFLEPSSGRVVIAGQNVEDEPLAVQRQLGYLPENLPVYPEMSVMEYLDYAATMRGLSGAERPAAIAEAVAATELGARAAAPIATLSRGFRQRVGVAQAIVHQPAYLILDEPTNGLDPGQTQHMRDLIRRLAERATVILSTHIMQEVSALCSRAIILRGGKLVLDEQLADLNRECALVLRTDAGEAQVSSALGDLATIATTISGGFRLSVADTSDSHCAQVARSLVEAGVAISSFSLETRDLEVLFREVNEDTNHAAA